jgi:hypothetical protein
MNDVPPKQPIEFSVRQLLGDIKTIACREPIKTGATAFAVGILFNLIPTRVMTGAITAVGTTLMRPALLSLGVYKAVELCCPKLLHHPQS